MEVEECAESVTWISISDTLVEIYIVNIRLYNMYNHQPAKDSNNSSTQSLGPNRSDN